MRPVLLSSKQGIAQKNPVFLFQLRSVLGEGIEKVKQVAGRSKRPKPGLGIEDWVLGIKDAARPGGFLLSTLSVSV